MRLTLGTACAAAALSDRANYPSGSKGASSSATRAAGSGTLAVVSAVMLEATKVSAVTLGWTGIGIAVTAGFAL